jgi:hypothetical protein
MPQACGVGLDTCWVVEVDPERFEVMVSEALDGIPVELGEFMSNVAVTVQNHKGPGGPVGALPGSAVDASVDFLRRRPARPDHDLPACHLRCLQQRPEVVEQVRRTLFHEVGHHFGIGDARLRELGW